MANTNVIKMQIQFRRDISMNWDLHKDVVPAEGEPCFVIDKNILKIGDGVTTFENLIPINSANIEIAADGKSLILDENTLKLMGFDDAEVGAQPRKNAEGFIEWVVPAVDENIDSLLVEVDALRTDVTTLQTDVAGLKEIISPSDVDVSSLLTKIQSLESKMDGKGEGTVDAKIDAKIEAFANNLTQDDGKVNTLLELINYVESHGQEAADMASDIAALYELVGDTKVSDQIGVAVAGLVKAEEGKGLSTNDFTHTLLEKLDGIESGAQVNKIEFVKVGNTVLDIVEKAVVIPVGAGLKASDEIGVADDGTLSIKTISFDKIVQPEETIIVMDGGNAV